MQQGAPAPQQREEDIVQKVMARLVPELSPVLDGLMGMQGRVDRTEKWQEAHFRWPDMELSEARNQNEYLAWRDVGRLLEVAKSMGGGQELQDILAKVAKTAEQRAAVVITADHDGWGVAGALGSLQKGSFLSDFKSDIASARKYKKAYTPYARKAKGEEKQSYQQPYQQQAPANEPSRNSLVCYSCQQTGHIARDCPVKAFRRGGAGEAPLAK